MADRINWPKPYRARAPNGDVLKADTQSELVAKVDSHARRNGLVRDYDIEREGRLEPQPDSAVTETDDEEA